MNGAQIKPRKEVFSKCVEGAFNARWLVKLNRRIGDASLRIRGRLFSRGVLTPTLLIFSLYSVAWIIIDHYERNSDLNEVLRDSARQWSIIEFMQGGDLRSRRNEDRHRSTAAASATTSVAPGIGSGKGTSLMPLAADAKHL